MRRRIRTAQLANREKRPLLRLRGPEPAVSGSDTRGRIGQDPANSRGFLSLGPSAGRKSLQQRTEWRCRQSIANLSLGTKSLICRESTGNLPGTGFRVGPDSPVQARFGVLRGLFP
jgi:hypothetical protein